MLQNPRKTLGFKKNMVYKIPPGGEVNHIQPVAYSRERTTNALVRLRGCIPLIFECSYVRFSLDTAHKYDNCHYNNCIVFQCFHTLATILPAKSDSAAYFVSKVIWDL